MRAIWTSAAFTCLMAAGLGAQTSDAAWLQRCDREDWGGDRERFCEVRVSGFRPGRGSIVVVPGTNGGASIEGWDRDSVSVHARIQANAEEIDDARALAREVDVRRNGNTIEADGPEPGRREGWSVQFVIYVPRRSNIEIETHNGPLSVRNVTGTMDLYTQNGPLSLSGVAGDVKARTQNGPLSVHLEGDRWTGAGLDAEAQNGPVTLFIPDNYSAELETGTINGPMTSDFPITVTLNGRMKSRITTRLGNGGAPVRVVTSNGPVSLRRSE